MESSWYVPIQNLVAVTVYKVYIFSEKATKFCEISTVDLSYVVAVKSTVDISQNFAAFSEYMNFTFDIYCANCWCCSLIFA